MADPINLAIVADMELISKCGLSFFSIVEEAQRVGAPVIPNMDDIHA